MNNFLNKKAEKFKKPKKGQSFTFLISKHCAQLKCLFLFVVPMGVQFFF